MPIRQPTPDPYAWWRRALNNPATPRYEDEPQAGYYRMRKVARGPWVPVEIRLLSITDENGDLTEPERLVAFENGQEIDLYRTWAFGQPIAREEFDALTERHRTDNTMAATHVARDLAATPTRPRR